MMAMEEEPKTHLLSPRFPEPGVSTRFHPMLPLKILSVMSKLSSASLTTLFAIEKGQEKAVFTFIFCSSL